MQSSRRKFIGTTLAAAAWGVPSIGVAGANNEVRLAVIGLRSKGSQHVELFGKMAGVRVVALCDPDREVLDRCAARFFKGKVATHTDLREVFDRKDVDAVCIATPNHWHALATIWACQAGKDVYVEKPVSHNVWEGIQMAAAARIHGRIVQAGTQSRSAPGMREFIHDLHQGEFGKILSARGLCYKRRDSIGKVAGPQPVPKQIDYNLWAGPRPMLPVMRKSFHYDWHWQWPWGNGDIGNQGPHQMDLCRWAVGHKGPPTAVVSLGGRFGYDDDGETPNSQVAILDCQPVPVVFEVRGLPEAATGNRMSAYRGGQVSIVIETEAGSFTGTNGGIFSGPDGKRIKAYPGGLGLEHHENFIAAVRSRKTSDLHAPIDEAQLSSAFSHLANISHRLGSAIPPERLRDECNGESLRSKVFERLLEHALVHEKDFAKRPMVLGPSLTIDAASGLFTGSLADEANKLLTEDYREPFVVPKLV